MILNQTLCSPSARRGEGEKKRRNTKLQQMKKMVEALKGREGQWQVSHTHTNLGIQCRLTQLQTWKRKEKNPHRKHTKWMHYTLKKRQISTWYQGRNYQPWLESISQNTYIHIYQTQMKTTSAIWFFFRKHEEGPMPWNGNNSFQSHNWGEEKASRPPEEMENIK